MAGTFAFCRTNEAIKRMHDGDILQHIESETYFKTERNRVFSSSDRRRWQEYPKPLEAFPPYDEWRSVTNLHYYDDLKSDYPDGALRYLTAQEKIITEDHPDADKSRKRWFAGGLLN